MKKRKDEVRIILHKIGISLKKRILPVLLYGVFFLLILLWFPCPFKFKVLTVHIPDTIYKIELWERPHFNYFILRNEYKTWFVCTDKNKRKKWFVIGKAYTVFRKVSVFISNDMNHLKIENSRWGSDITYLIAEYKIKEKGFQVKYDKSVRDKPGWKLISEKKVRD